MLVCNGLFGIGRHGIWIMIPGFRFGFGVCDGIWR
jgi:hypothetical protein